MRLRQLREEQKFSQADLGELLGMNQNTISRYETGVREPSIRDLVLIADYSLFLLIICCAVPTIRL